MENYGYMSAMRKYATFSGRAPRKEFWMFTLIYIIISIVANVIDIGILSAGVNSLGIVSTIVGLAHLVPSIAVTARRLHDVGRSGWWILIAFTGIGILLLLYWEIKGSQPGDNQYGPHPYGTANAEVFS